MSVRSWMGITVDADLQDSWLARLNCPPTDQWELFSVCSGHTLEELDDPRNWLRMGFSGDLSPNFDIVSHSPGKELESLRIRDRLNQIEHTQAFVRWDRSDESFVHNGVYRGDSDYEMAFVVVDSTLLKGKETPQRIEEWWNQVLDVLEEELSLITKEQNIEHAKNEMT